MQKLDFRKTRFTRIPINVLKEYGKELNSTDIVIYLFLAMKVDNETKEVVISTKTIANEIGISRRTVTTSITKLYEVGYIHIERRYRSDGGRASSRYTLCMI